MKLSIIMPCFNARETLMDAVNSLVKQNLAVEYEIVIVDDGSTDGTRELLKKLSHENKLIKHFFHPVNLGGGAARNTAVQNSSGEIIFCFDSDDILPPGILLQMIDYLDQKKLDGVVIGRSVFFTKDTNDIKFEVHYEEKSLIFKDLFTGKPMSIIGNFLYTRKAFEKVGGYPTAHGFDTQGYGFRFLANNLKVEVLKNSYYYQRLPESASYYIREVQSGNISKNWFYIYLDSFYKFNKPVQEFILNYPFMDYDFNNSTQNLQNAILKKQNIFNENMLLIDDQEAENVLTTSDLANDHIWLAARFLNLNNYQMFVSHLKLAAKFGGKSWPLLQLALIPIYSSGAFKYEEKTFEQLDFFSKRAMNKKEKLASIKSRVKNKIKRLIGLKND